MASCIIAAPTAYVSSFELVARGLHVHTLVIACQSLTSVLACSQSANNLLNRYRGSDTNLYQRNLEAQALMAQQQALGMGLQGLSSQTALDLLQGLQGNAYSQNAPQAAQLLQQQQQQNALAALGPTQQAALLRKVSCHVDDTLLADLVMHVTGVCVAHQSAG